MNWFIPTIRARKRLSVGLVAWFVSTIFTSMGIAEIKPGRYAAELQTPGGPIRFDLSLQNIPKWQARVEDPLEPISIPTVKVEGQQITLGFPHYDSAIKARLAGGELVGQYRRRRGKDHFAELKFTAKPIGPPDDSTVRGFKSLVGRWSVRFSRSDDAAIGVFSIRSSDKLPWGTFLTTTGDYRYLTGQRSSQKGHVELSVFDGAHAFLFRMKADDSDSIQGDFWSSDSWHESFTGKRNPDVELPDAFLLTTVLKGVNVNELRYPNLEGKLTALGDEKFAGKARVIQVFGSWCPNCHDAALYLAALHKKYESKGLKIVGLAFEHTGEFDRDVEMVKRYIKRHKTPYPVLLAGLSDKATATKQFPLLDKVRSYPTTIFVREDGSVRAVYTGFSGPATGKANEKLRARFESIIEELLK